MIVFVEYFVTAHLSGERAENNRFNGRSTHIDRPDRSYAGLASKRQLISFSGIELQSTPNQRVEAVLIVANFKYLNSLLVKETHDTIFSKKTRPTYPLTMGPLLI